MTGPISGRTGIEVVPTRGTGWHRVSTKGAAPVTIFEVSNYSAGVLLAFGGNVILTDRDELVKTLEEITKRVKEMAVAW